MKKKIFRNAILLKILAFILLIAPLATLFYLKKDVYFIKGESVKLSIGAMLTLIFILLIVLGKLKNVNGIIWLSIIWVLTIFMESILKDLKLILPLAISGLVLYNIINYFFNFEYQKFLKIKDSEVDEKIRLKAREEYFSSVVKENSRG